MSIRKHSKYWRSATLVMVALLKLETHNATLKYGPYVRQKQDA